MVEKLETAYSQYRTAVKIELVIYWLVYHLLILYFIFGKDSMELIASFFNDNK